MKKYLSFFRIRFATGLQYRTAAWAGLATQFAWGGLLIGMYWAFYQTDASQFPMTMHETASYVWMQQAFLMIFAAWLTESEILDTILNGNLAYELCRPIRIYSMWFARSVAGRLSSALMRCVPVLVLALLIPAPFGLIVPSSLAQFGWFLLSMVLGLLLTVAFCMLTYVLCFFTISPQGLSTFLRAAVEFLSGAVIPLPFLPDRLRGVLELLPFAGMQNTPLRIYSGSIAGPEIYRTVLLQAFWLVLLVAAGQLLGRVAERRAVIQGG